jgi:hypothetical protein
MLHLFFRGAAVSQARSDTTAADCFVIMIFVHTRGCLRRAFWTRTQRVFQGAGGKSEQKRTMLKECGGGRGRADVQAGEQGAAAFSFARDIYRVRMLIPIHVYISSYRMCNLKHMTITGQTTTIPHRTCPPRQSRLVPSHLRCLVIEERLLLSFQTFCPTTEDKTIVPLGIVVSSRALP